MIKWSEAGRDPVMDCRLPTKKSILARKLFGRNPVRRSRPKVKVFG